MESISSVESKTVTSPYFIKNYLEETKSLCELEKGLTMLLSNDVSIWKSDVAFLKFFCSANFYKNWQNFSKYRETDIIFGFRAQKFTAKWS